MQFRLSGIGRVECLTFFDVSVNTAVAIFRVDVCRFSKSYTEQAVGNLWDMKRQTRGLPSSRLTSTWIRKRGHEKNKDAVVRGNDTSFRDDDCPMGHSAV